jgi:PTH1 family peptidyl-tRNA hydrolase
MARWLVAGLGNPGQKYERNRHNVGFRVVDELSRQAGLPSWSKKLGGETTAGLIPTPGGGHAQAVLLKPMEYMNLSGFAVQRLAQFHKIEPEHILVVHDEIDLPFGAVRLKSGGGHGGHNGLRSIIEQLGSKFARVRVGVGRDPSVPPGKAGDPAGWVLSDFPAAQLGAVDEVIRTACEATSAVLAVGIVAAMSAQNGRPGVTTPGTRA